MSSPRARAITFDCWGTLLFDRSPADTYARRVETLARSARSAGLDAGAEAARSALDRAWEHHWNLWHAGVASGSREIAAWALGALAAERGAPAPEAPVALALGAELAAAGLSADVRPLEGARETLLRLSRLGVRRALICDTGFTPGPAVRRLLDRAGLLEHLEVTVFSDEAGAPKPSPRVFASALGSLGVADERRDSLHVGDLLRTDVAGGRAAGMQTVRIRAHYDDPSELPEADWVAESHGHLLEILKLG